MRQDAVMEQVFELMCQENEDTRSATQAQDLKAAPPIQLSMGSHLQPTRHCLVVSQLFASISQNHG